MLLNTLAGRKIKRGLILTGASLLLVSFFICTQGLAQQSVNAGQTTAPIAFPGSGCVYNWTNDHPEIGLVASGTGNIPSFTATNSGTTPITATIKAAPAGLAYMGSPFNNNVTIVDLSTYQIIKTLNIGKAASYQNVSPDGKHVYLISYFDNTLTVINTADNSFNVLNVGSQPYYVIASPDNSKFYVSSNYQGAIRVYNAATNTQTNTINVGVPGNMIISPDGSKLYVLVNYAITEINTSTFAQTTYTLSDRPSGIQMAISPDGKEIYIATFSGNITVFNTTSKSVTGSIAKKVNPGDFALSADGKKLYVTNLISSSISVIDLGTQTVSAVIPVTYSPNGIDLSPDGSRFYVTDADKKIWAYSTADNSFITSFNAGSSPGGINSFVIPGACAPQTVTITVNPTVAPPVGSPIIAPTGTPTARTTVYGDASAASNFKVSASNLTDAVLVTPPPGFEVSLDGTTFSPTVSITNNGTLDSYIVYIRLAAITNVGTYQGDITLSSTGANNKTVAMPLSTVTKAPLTIAAFDVHKPYGDILSNMTGTGVYHVVAGALKNGNTLNTVTIIYGNGAQATAPAGTYTGSVHPQAATGDNGFLATNYDITYKDADIIIDKAPLTIKVADRTKVYGTTIVPPAGTNFMTTGLRNNELATSITVVYSTAAAATTKVGTYPDAIISSNARGNNFNPDNYDITYVTASIIVTPAQLSITADNKTRAYGRPNPALTATFTGFVNGETRVVLTTQPTISTTANLASPAGQYPITVSGASADNYLIGYADGTLTISGTPPPPVIALVIPNTFTPNGDGVNDQWLLPVEDVNPGTQVTVFNRLGTRVFYSLGYSIPWDGTFNAQPLPAGTYYYIIDPKNGGLVQAGSVTIIR